MISSQLEPKDLKYGYRCDDTSVVARADAAKLRERNALSNGPGLGLAISRRRASAMSGSLTATSDLGRGSTFTL